MCPCTYACVVSDSDNQGTGLSILQCCLYPCLVPVLRYKARKTRQINGTVIGDIIAGICCPMCVCNLIISPLFSLKSFFFSIKDRYTSSP